VTLPFITQLGVDFIARSEGLKLKAYKCPAGVWTIGYGHTSAMGAPEVYPGMVITVEQAADILQDDIERVEAILRRHIKVPLTQSQYAALVSFVFNIGGPKFAKSTLLRLLNKRDYDSVPAQLLRWTHSNGAVLPGLVTRRTAEAAMWGGGTDGDPIPQRVDAPKANLKPTVGHVGAAAGGATAANLPDAVMQLLPHVSAATIEHYAIITAAGMGLFLLGLVTDRFILQPRKESL
jgi:lysozyme